MIDGPILEGLTFDDVLLLPGKSSDRKSVVYGKIVDIGGGRII